MERGRTEMWSVYFYVFATCHAFVHSDNSASTTLIQRPFQDKLDKPVTECLLSLGTLSSTTNGYLLYFTCINLHGIMWNNHERPDQYYYLYMILGYWHQRADERHDNPPQGYQELLVVRDKVGRPQAELWVSKSMECDIFPLVL